MTDSGRLTKVVMEYEDGLKEYELVKPMSYAMLVNYIGKVEDLLDRGYTIKKKREYIRKSPCKCGADARWVIDWSHSYGTHVVACRKCVERAIANNKEKALIEWNKMNEVRE